MRKDLKKNNRNFAPQEEFRSSKPFSRLGEKKQKPGTQKIDKNLRRKPISHCLAESYEGKKSDVNVHLHSCGAKKGKMDPRGLPKPEDLKI